MQGEVLRAKIQVHSQNSKFDDIDKDEWGQIVAASGV